VTVSRAGASVIILGAIVVGVMVGIRLWTLLGGG